MLCIFYRNTHDYAKYMYIRICACARAYFAICENCNITHLYVFDYFHTECSIRLLNVT